MTENVIVYKHDGQPPFPAEMWPNSLEKNIKTFLRPSES